MNPSKTYLKWLSRVHDHETPWTENEIKYFRKAIGCCGLKNIAERKDLLKKFEGPYSITLDQTEKGYNYIYNRCFKKNGEISQSKENPFGQFESQVIWNFSHFEFVDVETKLHPFTDEIMQVLPVYRVHSLAGESFDYTTDMGQMEVVAINPTVVNVDWNKSYLGVVRA